MLNIERKMDDNALFMTLEGKIDTLTAPDLEAEIEPLLGELTSLTLDFEKVDYISSAGLRVLLATQQAMEERSLGAIRIIHANEAIRDIFDITGFAGILSLE